MFEQTFKNVDDILHKDILEGIRMNRSENTVESLAEKVNETDL